MIIKYIGVEKKQTGPQIPHFFQETLKSAGAVSSPLLKGLGFSEMWNTQY